MKDIEKLRIINQLKYVKRRNTAKDRFESPAEHSWSTLILADYFSKKIKEKLDMTKVHDLIIYHDMVEIYADDNPVHPDHKKRSDKEQEKRETEAAKKLRKELPTEISEKFYSCFNEFEECKTREAKFAKAMDKLDPIILGMDHKDKWGPWTKEIVYTMKKSYMQEFPDLLRIFNELLDYLEKEGYFKN